jgi:hypothetical protein
MALPPLGGAVQVIVADPFPALAATAVGAPGAVVVCDWPMLIRADVDGVPEPLTMKSM